MAARDWWRGLRSRIGQRKLPFLLTIGWIGASAPLVVMTLVAIIAWESLRDPKRSFIVDARATGVTVTFEGSTNAWPLGQAVVCRRREAAQIDASRSTPPGQPCDQATSENVTGFFMDRDGDVEIALPEGAQARLLATPEGGLDITLSGVDGLNLTDSSRILVPPESWSRNGALGFIGAATIGNSAGSGERRLLLVGRYEAREPTGFGQSVSQTVLEGLLNRGDEVQILVPEGDRRSQSTLADPAADGPPDPAPLSKGRQLVPAQVFGHVTPGEEDERGFHVVLISQPGRTELSISSIGQDSMSKDDGVQGAVRIRPNWMDRTLKGSFLLAVTVVVTLGIGAGQLFFEAISLLQSLYTEQSKRTRPMKRVGRQRT